MKKNKPIKKLTKEETSKLAKFIKKYLPDNNRELLENSFNELRAKIKKHLNRD